MTSLHHLVGRWPHNQGESHPAERCHVTRDPGPVGGNLRLLQGEDLSSAVGPQLLLLHSCSRSGRLCSGHRKCRAIDRGVLYIRQALLSRHPPDSTQHTSNILPQDGPRAEVASYSAAGDGATVVTGEGHKGLHWKALGPH